MSGSSGASWRLQRLSQAAAARPPKERNDPSGQIGSGLCFPDANPALFDDPNTAGQRLPLKQWKDLLQGSQHVISVLAAQSQQDAPWRSSRGAKVGKVQVERNKSPPFGGTDFSQLRVVFSRQILVMDCQRVVARISQHGGCFNRQVLV